MLPLVLVICFTSTSSVRVDSADEYAAGPIAIDSHVSMGSLRPSGYEKMSFDGAAAALAGKMSQEYTHFIGALNRRIKECPACVDVLAAGLNYEQMSSAWAKLSLAVHAIDMLANSTWSSATTSEGSIDLPKALAGFRGLLTKLKVMVIDYISNDYFFNKQACEEGLNLICVISMATAVVNTIGTKYFQSLLAVMMSIATDAVAATQDMWMKGVTGASLWKLSFSVIRLVVFVSVAVPHGKAMGQLGDSIMRLGVTHSQQLGQLASALMLMSLGSSKLVVAGFLAALHECFKGAAIIDLDEALVKMQLGKMCTDKLALSTVQSSDVPLTEASVVTEIRNPEDLVPQPDWQSMVLKEPERVLNSFLWQQALVRKGKSWLSSGTPQLQHHWQTLLERHEKLRLEASDRLQGPNRRLVACQVAEQSCKNARPPAERPVDFAADGFSSAGDWVVEPVDDVQEMALTLPPGYECCLMSKTC